MRDTSSQSQRWFKLRSTEDRLLQTRLYNKNQNRYCNFVCLDRSQIDQSKTYPNLKSISHLLREIRALKVKDGQNGEGVTTDLKTNRAGEPTLTNKSIYLDLQTVLKIKDI